MTFAGSGSWTRTRGKPREIAGDDCDIVEHALADATGIRDIGLVELDRCDSL